MTIFDVLTLVTGLALFLYGMGSMSDGLKKSAGTRLKFILGKMTSSPLRGFLLGLGVTAVIQSSSATTVMIVGFVNSGTMTLAQSVWVIMGANVGAAVTFWLTGLSGLGGTGSAAAEALRWLKPSSWIALVALAGVCLFMFAKHGKRKDIGTILLGFAILMVGMDLMSSSVEGLKESPAFGQILTAFNNPALGILTGTVVTAVIQSSAASVGILQSLSTTGAITYATAIPIIMGQNIGTCITALISSISANKNGKRAAIVHLLFNVLGSLFWLTVYVILGAIFRDFIAPLNGAAIDMFGIAGVHTVFKVLSVALFLPFENLLERLSKIIIREKQDEKQDEHLLDTRLLTTPSVAVERATEVTLTMAEIAFSSILKSLRLLNGYDAKIAAEVREEEEKVDMYEDDLGTFLVTAASRSMDEADSRQITKLLHVIGDVERISDHAVNVVESAEEMQDKKIEFSEEAKKELTVLTAAVTEILGMTLTCFKNNDLVSASFVEPLEQVVDLLREQVKHNHVLRLQKSECTIEHGFVLSDILTNFERVSDHCSNIAGCVIEISAHDALDMHKYLAEIKHDDEDFKRKFEVYKEKYAL